MPASHTLIRISTPASVSVITDGSNVTIQTGFQPTAASDPAMLTGTLPVHWTSMKNANPAAIAASACCTACTARTFSSVCRRRRWFARAALPSWFARTLRGPSSAASLVGECPLSANTRSRNSG